MSKTKIELETELRYERIFRQRYEGIIWEEMFVGKTAEEVEGYIKMFEGLPLQTSLIEFQINSQIGAILGYDDE